MKHSIGSKFCFKSDGFV